ncbi:MAG TPA: ribosome recycling factor, partial [Firmicutes bacterium]|nr:ribosome recycling factor [Bacillota bacterium]
NELKGYTEDVQKLTDKKIKEVEAVAADKEKDIMSL